MTKIELEKIANLDTNCTSCNQSNSLMETARRDTKFKFEFEATQWVCIMKALTSSLNSIKKAADKSEAVNYVVETEIWHHKRLINKIKTVVHDKHGYINSSDEDCLKTIDRWLLEYSEC